MKYYATSAELLKKLLPEVEIMAHKVNKNDNVSSGFFALDKITNGFSKGELILVSVRPGMGKTSFMLSLLSNISILQKKSVVIFSLERTAEKLIQRLIESETGQSISKINSGKTNLSKHERIKHRLINISNSNIKIFHNPVYLIDDLTFILKSFDDEQVSDIVFIDYLELIKNVSTTEDENEKKAEIINLLKKTAKEISIPIIVFSQIPEHEMFNWQMKNIPFEKSPKYFHYSDTVMYLCRTAPSDNYAVNDNFIEIIVSKHFDNTEPQIAYINYINAIDRFV